MPLPHIPDHEYFATLPKVLVAAALLIRDPADRILLVHPTYQDHSWLLPGGTLDPDEDAWRCAQREVTEELGLEVEPGRLLLVDWTVANHEKGRPPLLNLIFDGGVMTEEQLCARVVLQTEELRDWRLVAAQDLETVLVPVFAQRARHALEQVLGGSVAYLREASVPTSR